MLPLGVHGYTPSKTFYKTHALSAGAMSFTTAIKIADSGFLNTVAVNFSTPPNSDERITLSIASRNGTNFNQLLAATTALSGVTTKVTFIVGDQVPVGTGDQVLVTCTNTSTNATVYVAVLVSQDVRNGSGMGVYRDGMLVSSQGWGTKHTFVPVSIPVGGIGETVVPATWVIEGMSIVCSPQTPSSTHDLGMEYVLNGLAWAVTDVSPGVGFTLAVLSQTASDALYGFSCIGVL